MTITRLLGASSSGSCCQDRLNESGERGAEPSERGSSKGSGSHDFSSPDGSLPPENRMLMSWPRFDQTITRKWLIGESCTVVHDVTVWKLDVVAGRPHSNRQ